MKIHPSIELLEARIAPASVLVFTDTDGDTVTIKSTRGDLTAAGVATFESISLGQQLQLLTLTDASFKNASLSTSIVKSATGDGLVNIGRISASGNDLGSVQIKGDLGSITCGDAQAKTGPGLALLNVRSLGLYGTTTQGSGGGLNSVVEGSFGVLKVAGDIKGASIGARNFGDSSDGTIDRVTVGGSLLGTGISSGMIFSTGDLRSVKIAGDIVGGSSTSSGEISCNGKIVSLTVGGSLIGGGGFLSGVISAQALGVVKIQGDVRGGTAAATGFITSTGRMESLTIQGSLIGGTGNTNYTQGSTFVYGQIIASGEIGALKIGHDVIGSAGTGSGSILALAGLRSITIGGSLLGGSAAQAGQLHVEGTLGQAVIGGSIEGGTANQTGEIFVQGSLKHAQIGVDLRGGSIAGSAATLERSGSILADRVGSILIGGSIITGLDTSTGGDLLQNAAIASEQEIGALTIRGSLIGNAGDGMTANLTEVVISARGQAAALAPDARIDLALKSLTIGGRVEFAKILAGYTPTLDAINGNASIGTVTIGGTWQVSDLVAGVQDDGDAALDDNFGDGDEQVIAGFDGDALTARIASITIKGAVLGAANPFYQNAFTAQQIGVFKAAKFSAPLTSGLDGPFLVAPSTANVNVFEV